ncbi:hypothetical protein ACWCRD_41070 [Streptomyces sp. NPDC002092]
MAHSIARLFGPLLRLLLPAPGRHRTPASRSRLAAPPPNIPTARLPRVPPLRGEDNALVRPYVVAHERHRWEGQRERARRRTLVFVTHGVYTTPRRMHGAAVTAR